MKGREKGRDINQKLLSENTFILKPRDDEKLSRICESVTKEITTTDDFVKRTYLLRYLSSIEDPVVIPYLNKLLKLSLENKQQSIDIGFVIGDLSTFKTVETTGTLIGYYNKIKNKKDLDYLAAGIMDILYRTYLETNDEKIKSMIKQTKGILSE
jgi:hypothetical protein